MLQGIFYLGKEDAKELIMLLLDVGESIVISSECCFHAPTYDEMEEAFISWENTYNDICPEFNIRKCYCIDVFAYLIEQEDTYHLLEMSKHQFTFGYSNHMHEDFYFSLNEDLINLLKSHLMDYGSFAFGGPFDFEDLKIFRHDINIFSAISHEHIIELNWDEELENLIQDHYKKLYGILKKELADKEQGS
jgi:hypothetical protein